MNMIASAQRNRDDEQRARVSELLSRYPEATEAEVGEILLFLKKGPLLDIGILTANEELQANLQRFRQDHASAFSLNLKDYWMLAMVLAVIVAVCVYLWDAGLT